jgi:glycosyltransferase involved in cell wall biosynthesis
VRILLVSHGYPPRSVAGVERLTAQTAAALAARGHAVTVLTRDPGAPGSPLQLRRRTDGAVSILSVEGGGSDFGRFPRRETQMERIFERVLLEVEPQVASITHLMHHSPGYVEVAHRWGVPVVLELHDFFAICPRAHLERRTGDLCAGPDGGRACATYCFPEQDRPQLRWSLRAHSFGQALDAADGLLAPSSYVVKTMERARGKELPIRVVENAIGPLGPVLRARVSEAGGLRLASVGVTVAHKGFQVVLEALRTASLPQVSYTIFGVPLRPLAQELHRAAERVPGLELRLAGGFEPHHLPVLLADVDLMLVPSVVPETYSIVAREGFACGIPVVASRIGALAAAVEPDRNGWLFDPGDAVGLAQLLQELDRDRSRIASAAAGARATQVTRLEERTDQIEALLAEIVARGPKPRSDAGEEAAAMRAAWVEQPALAADAP